MKQKHKTLTRREIEVLLLISKGHSTKEIADILSVHFETVKTHRKNIIYKFESKEMKLSTIACR